LRSDKENPISFFPFQLKEKYSENVPFSPNSETLKRRACMDITKEKN
jgi:hypothetical protein